jgi:hypothetical protein
MLFPGHLTKGKFAAGVIDRTPFPLMVERFSN